MRGRARRRRRISGCSRAREDHTGRGASGDGPDASDPGPSGGVGPPGGRGPALRAAAREGGERIWACERSGWLTWIRSCAAGWRSGRRWRSLCANMDSTSQSFEQREDRPGMDRLSRVMKAAALCETELILFKASPIHGTGGFAKAAIRKGTRVIEYVGERISKSESLRRCEQNNEYHLRTERRAGPGWQCAWNPARLLNHSCTPNCEAETGRRPHLDHRHARYPGR